MGYSIMTPFASEKTKQEISTFLERNFKPFKTLAKEYSIKGWEGIEHSKRVPSDKMSYGPDDETPVLGFNLNGAESELERDYLFLICYWMAVMSGKQKSIEENNTMPYVLYDGAEEWVLYVNKERNVQIESTEVDQYGYRPSPNLKKLESKPFLTRFLLFSVLRNMKKADKAMQEEVIRLTNLWKETV